MGSHGLPALLAHAHEILREATANPDDTVERYGFSVCFFALCCIWWLHNLSGKFSHRYKSYGLPAIVCIRNGLQRQKFLETVLKSTLSLHCCCCAAVLLLLKPTIAAAVAETLFILKAARIFAAGCVLWSTLFPQLETTVQPSCRPRTIRKSGTLSALFGCAQPTFFAFKPLKIETSFFLPGYSWSHFLYPE